jgi:CheY-like chemotaxis protein/AraC-like DNA-binding protein
MRSVLCAAAMLMAAAASSQPYCRVRTFTITDGLAANNVSEFSQSADGIMWVSTWNGLCSYDGYGFSKFRDTPGTGQVLTSNRIKLMRPNSQGDIWLSLYDGSTYLFSRSTYSYIPIDRLLRKAVPGGFRTRNIVSLGNGSAWLLGNGSLNFHIDEAKVKQGGGITLVDTRRMRHHGHIRKVLTDSKGREWLFSGDGVTLYGSGTTLDYPFEYMCEAGGQLYFATRGGILARYSKKSPGLVAKIRLDGSPGAISNIKNVGNGVIAIATDKGVAMYNTRTGRSWTVSIAPAGQPEGVRAIFTDSRHRIWTFTDAPGVSLIDADGHSVTHLKTQSPGLYGTSSRLPVMHEDGNHTVWLVPTGGTFSYFDEDSRTLVPYNLNGHSGMRMPVRSIVKYTGDRQGNLWLTGDHNLTLVSFKFHRFKFTRTLPGDDTRSVMPDGHGNVWTGSVGGHLTVHPASGGAPEYVRTDGTLSLTPTVFSPSGVYAIHCRHDGQIWIGTKGDGLYVLTPAKGRYAVRHFVHSEADRRSISHNNIYDIMEEPGGRMWVATYGGGLNIAADNGRGGLRFINSRSGLSPFRNAGFNEIRKLSMTPKGVIAASTTGGLVTFSAKETAPGKIKYYYSTYSRGDTASLLAPDVLNAYACKHSGKLYVTTMGGGFQCADADKLLRDGIRFDGVDGLDPDDGMVLSMVEDGTGGLWLVRENSLNRLDCRSGRIEVYGPNDWDDDTEFTEAEPAMSLDGGEIMLGVAGGYMRFNPGKIEKSAYRPAIVFNGIRYQGEQHITPLLENGAVTIPADKRAATIYFSALDYSDNRLIRYAYRIKELDSQWSYTGTEHSAPLGHIPPGRYTLEVRSTNSDGVWTDNNRELQIRVMPTFWESGWAWVIYIAAAMAVVFALLYVWRLRQKAILERHIKERQLDFFTGISHQLRTPLTLIGGPVDQVLNDEPLSAKARTYLEFVRRNARRMLELVDKSLDLKKLTTLNSEMEEQLPPDITPADDAQPAAATAPPCGNSGGAEGTKMLVVEDNDELRQFLTGTLEAEYAVTAARNGKEGLELAKSIQPDFIITDIMMPVMDGMEMVRRIKADAQICHIPIIVLSARTAMSYRIEGLNEGVDDYITKPFSVSYLKSRVANIIRQRRRLQQLWLDKLKESAGGNTVIDTGAPGMADADKDFADRLLKFIDAHAGDAELKIDDMARALAVSRTVLYGKVKALSGMSPVDFVRHVRIMKAEKMVAETDMTLSEIAYATGFTDPKYFSRTFKLKTGLTPSEYRKSRGKGNGDSQQA